MWFGGAFLFQSIGAHHQRIAVECDKVAIERRVDRCSCCDLHDVLNLRSWAVPVTPGGAASPRAGLNEDVLKEGSTTMVVLCEFVRGDVDSQTRCHREVQLRTAAGPFCNCGRPRLKDEPGLPGPTSPALMCCFCQGSY